MQNHDLSNCRQNLGKIYFSSKDFWSDKAMIITIVIIVIKLSIQKKIFMLNIFFKKRATTFFRIKKI